MQEKLGRRGLFIGISKKKEETTPGSDSLKENIEQAVAFIDAIENEAVSTRITEPPQDSPLFSLIKRINALADRIESDRAEISLRDKCIEILPLPCGVYRADGSLLASSMIFQEEKGSLPLPAPEDISAFLDGIEKGISDIPAGTDVESGGHHFRISKVPFQLSDGTRYAVFTWDDVTPYHERIRELKASQVPVAAAPVDTAPPVEPPQDIQEISPQTLPDQPPESEPVLEIVALSAPGQEETTYTASCPVDIPVTTVENAPETALPEEDEDALLVASILKNAGFSAGVQDIVEKTKEEDAPEQEEVSRVTEPQGSPGQPAEEVQPERATDAVAVQEPEGVEEDQIGAEIEVVEFSLGQEAYAIDISLAREIVEMMTITPIPRAPPYLAGVLNLRGEITNIITITTILGVSNTLPQEDQKIIVLSSEAAGGENVGIIVDDVRSVSQIPRGRIERLGAGVVGKTKANIKGIIKKEEHDGEKADDSHGDYDLVLWLDLKKVLNELMNQ